MANGTAESSDFKAYAFGNYNNGYSTSFLLIAEREGKLFVSYSSDIIIWNKFFTDNKNKTNFREVTKSDSEGYLAELFHFGLGIPRGKV